MNMVYSNMIRSYQELNQRKSVKNFIQIYFQLPEKYSLAVS